LGAKSVCLPFFDRFSPFSTVFAGAPDRESFDVSSAWRATPLFTPLENGEDGENDNATV
jgi:hypothetical protein